MAGEMGHRQAGQMGQGQVDHWDCYSVESVAAMLGVDWVGMKEGYLEHTKVAWLGWLKGGKVVVVWVWRVIVEWE